MAHSPAAGWLLFPPVAAAVDLGGLWLLYRTDLWAAAHRNPLLGGLLELHMLLAGLVFAMAVCRLDPVRGRCGLPLRAVTLLATGAAHAVLAKSLYVAGPPGPRSRRPICGQGRGSCTTAGTPWRCSSRWCSPCSGTRRPDGAGRGGRLPSPWARADPGASQSYDDQGDVVAAAVGDSQAGEQGVGEGLRVEVGVAGERVGEA